MLLDAFLTKVRHRASEVDTSDFFTDAVLIGYLNDGLNDVSVLNTFQGQDGLATTDFTADTDTGLHEADLPDDFLMDDSVKDSDGELVNKVNYEDVGLVADSDNFYYYIRDSKIGFNKQPDEAFVLAYFRKHPDVTAGQSGNIFDAALTGWEEMLVSAVLARMFEDDKQYDEAQYHLGRFSQKLSQFTLNRKLTKMGQVGWRVPSRETPTSGFRLS